MGFDIYIKMFKDVDSENKDVVKCYEKYVEV